MNTLWKAEPSMILAVVSSGIALGIGFGLHITTQQMGLIMAFVSAVLGLINRQQVTSPATLQASSSDIADTRDVPNVPDTVTVSSLSTRRENCCPGDGRHTSGVLASKSLTFDLRP